MISVKGASNITIAITNDGAFNNTYELYDNVCKKALPDMRVNAHEKAFMIHAVVKYRQIATGATPSRTE